MKHFKKISIHNFRNGWAGNVYWIGFYLGFSAWLFCEPIDNVLLSFLSWMLLAFCWYGLMCVIDYLIGGR